MAVRNRVLVSLFSLVLLSPAVRSEQIIAFTSMSKPFSGEKELVSHGHAAHVFFLNGVSSLVGRLNVVGKTAVGKSEQEQQALIDTIRPIVSSAAFKELARMELQGRLYHKSLGLSRLPAVVINDGSSNYVVYGETDLVKAYRALVLLKNTRTAEH